MNLNLLVEFIVRALDFSSWVEWKPSQEGESG